MIWELVSLLCGLKLLYLLCVCVSVCYNKNVCCLRVPFSCEDEEVTYIDPKCLSAGFAFRRAWKNNTTALQKWWDVMRFSGRVALWETKAEADRKLLLLCLYQVMLRDIWFIGEKMQNAGCWISCMYGWVIITNIRDTGAHDLKWHLGSTDADGCL